MSLMMMLESAQGGQLFSHVARSLDLDEGETRKAMGKLCPAIAKKLKAAAAADEDLLESLLDLIEDGAGALPLEEPEALTDAEAVSDGNAILGDIYGSRNAAMVSLRKVAKEVPERELTKLAPISATAVLAALAQTNQPPMQPQTLAATQPAAAASSSGGLGGVVGTIIGAVIAGAVSSVVRELTSAKRWRGTTSYTKTRTRRKTSSTKSRTAKKKTASATARRRTASSSIEDIFRDILGNIGK